jgi:hypothetical protein
VLWCQLRGVGGIADGKGRACCCVNELEREDVRPATAAVDGRHLEESTGSGSYSIAPTDLTLVVNRARSGHPLKWCYHQGRDFNEIGRNAG